MTTLGIIGSGKIGSNVARAVIAHGYDVVLSNSRGPETLGDLVAELGPNARAATIEEAAAAGDLVLVAIPFKAIETLPADALADKVVIDADNYYFERDGHYPAIDSGDTTASGVLQAHLAESMVVKGFNSIYARDIPTDGTPTGTANRRAIAIASDYPEAAAAVTDLFDLIGFDVVNIGPLAESWRVDRDQPAYGVRLNRDELVEALAKASRPVG